MEVLEKIEKLRKEKGWSINYLAMESGLTQSTLIIYILGTPSLKFQPYGQYVEHLA